MSGRCWNRRGWERAGRNPRGGTLNPVKLLRAGSATKRTPSRRNHFSGSAKIPGNEAVLSSRMIKQRGAIMLALILNAIYRQYLRAALQGIARQGGKL